MLRHSSNEGPNDIPPVSGPSENVIQRNNDPHSTSFSSFFSRLFSTESNQNIQNNALPELTLSLSQRTGDISNNNIERNETTFGSSVIHALRSLSNSNENTSSAHQQHHTLQENLHSTPALSPEHPALPIIHPATDSTFPTTTTTTTTSLPTSSSPIHHHEHQDVESGTIQEEYSFLNDTTPPTDVSAEAERVRLTTLSSIDVRRIIHTIEGTFPFVFLILCVFFIHHIVSILSFSLGTFGIHMSNKLLRREIARKEDMERKKIAGCGIFLIAQAVLVGVIGLQGKLGALFILYGDSSRTGEFWPVFFTVIITDLFIRSLLASSKSIIILFARSDSTAQCRKRNGLLSALDYCTSIYRSLVPTSFWLHYFRDAHVTIFLSFLLSGVYLIVKASNIIEKTSLAISAIAQWRGVKYGRLLSIEELNGGGPKDCPICQEEVRIPLQLSCQHIFCESCINEWMEREATCPMCRHVVRKATLKPRGDGGTTLLPTIC